MIYHCLFEQSGTFKNVLKANGYQAFDYDILNDYGQTDRKIDIFKEIELEYDNIVNGGVYNTIFSQMTKENDFILAFFPCTHFYGLNQFQYKLLIAGKKRTLDKKAITRLIKRNNERTQYFNLYMMLCFICQSKGLKCIIENPASCSGNHSFLELFSPIPIGYRETNRQKWGDYFRKPTNYFAINFEMIESYVEPTPCRKEEKKTILDSVFGMSARSMISSLYAENFYKRFLKEK